MLHFEIADVEPAKQPAILHDAWRDYAVRAARSYAWSTFAKYAREHLAEAGEPKPEQHAKEKLTLWQEGTRASPRVLAHPRPATFGRRFGFA